MLLLWLMMQEAPDDGIEAVMLRYDRQYAANIALGRYDPECYMELVNETRKVAAQVMSKSVITWQHVYCHIG